MLLYISLYTHLGDLEVGLRVGKVSERILAIHFTIQVPKNAYTHINI